MSSKFSIRSLDSFWSLFIVVYRGFLGLGLGLELGVIMENIDFESDRFGFEFGFFF